MARSKGPKTVSTTASVAGYLAALPEPERREEGLQLKALIEAATGEPAEMWGEGIVGSGRYRLDYADGRQADWPLAAFSARKREWVFYLMQGFEDQTELLQRLGPHKTGKVCLYLKRLAGLDLEALAALVRAGVASVASRRVTPEQRKETAR